MSTYVKRLRRNVSRNQLLDRELDYLPCTVNRDDVREIARRYGPLRRRSVVRNVFTGTSGFILRYGAPLVGLIAGAEFRAAKALYPLMGKEEKLGESLRFFLGEDLSRKVSNTKNVYEMAGALVAATPSIIFSALYGAVLGIVFYYLLRWAFFFGMGLRRRRVLGKKLKELVE